jgi:hypothetical protein
VLLLANADGLLLAFMRSQCHLDVHSLMGFSWLRKLEMNDPTLSSGLLLFSAGCCWIVAGCCWTSS